MKTSLFLLLVFSWGHAISQNKMIDTSKVKPKGCEYVVYHYPDSTKKEEGCLVKGIREGSWIIYTLPRKFFEVVTYVHGVKTGRYQEYYATGELRQTGTYKNNTRSDTITTFKQNSDTIAKFYCAYTGLQMATVTWRKYYDSNAKPDGAFETKDGKTYMWMLGEMVEFNYTKRN